MDNVRFRNTILRVNVFFYSVFEMRVHLSTHKHKCYIALSIIIVCPSIDSTLNVLFTIPLPRLSTPFSLFCKSIPFVVRSFYEFLNVHQTILTLYFLFPSLSHTPLSVLGLVLPGKYCPITLK